MKGRLISLCLVIFFLSPLTAQESRISAETSIEGEEINYISQRLDQLEDTKAFGKTRSSVYDTLIYNTHQFRPDEVPTYSSEVVKQRLRDLPAIISLDYNHYVQNYIDLYTLRRRDQMSRMLGISKVYFPIFEEELDKAGLPLELKYLPIVESALNPQARSRAGAVGLWQFMLWTAKSYGLKINSFVDERKDPYKSTKAAIAYLQDAYDEFGDWLLAIAAYNCGRGNVRKAILRSGGLKNFWEIRRYLPRETRGYVPGFIAATYSFEYASEHNLYPVYVDLDLEQDTIHIKRMEISLANIADMTHTDLSLLTRLNPALKYGRIPYMGDVYVLNAPANVGEYFARYGNNIKSRYGNKRQTNARSSHGSKRSNSSQTTAVHQSSARKTPPGKPTYYIVKSGDVVGSIAEKYQVSARQVAYWNNLRNYRIKVGQKLVLYTNGKQLLPSTDESIAKRTYEKGVNNHMYYTIQKGDTLWDIARRHDDINVSQILALNPGLKAGDLDVGQKIRLR